ncbi:MAG: aminoacyl-tRNA hydrolase [Planctomycetaceae bacterium]|jgi:ribosome-associated protein|nr:aminoacyl-tRNA hydrolase [Planctomycetaceae bacterium]
MLYINSRLQIPIDEIRYSYARSSGPGGQNVNKVSSKVILRWTASRLSDLEVECLAAKFPRFWSAKNHEVIITSQRQRDSTLNKKDCLEKFIKIIKDAAKIPKKRIPTKPTKNSIKKRLENKAKNAIKKQNRKILE